MKRLLLCAALLNLTACPELTKVPESEPNPLPCAIAASMIAPPVILKLRVSKSLFDHALLMPIGLDYYISLTCEASPPYHGATKVYCANAKIIDLNNDFKEITVQSAYFLEGEDRPRPEEVSLVDAQGNLVGKMSVTLQKTETPQVYPRSSSCGDQPATYMETIYSGELRE